MFLLVTSVFHFRSDLPYRLEKKSEFGTFLSIESIEQFLSRIKACDDVRQIANVCVSLIFKSTEKNIIQGPYCTFGKVSHSQPLLSEFDFFLRCKLPLNSQWNSVPLSTQVFLGRLIFLIKF